jgi:hypothetical protein
MWYIFGNICNKSKLDSGGTYEDIEFRQCLLPFSPKPFCLLVCYLKTYKNIILPVVLYGCETWSLTLREEHRLRAFENRLLRKIELKRDEVVGGWRKLHNEKLHNLYSSPSIIRIIMSRRLRWAGHVA